MSVPPPKIILWVVTILCAMGLAVAFTETCWYVEIVNETAAVRHAMGCD